MITTLGEFITSLGFPAYAPFTLLGLAWVVWTLARAWDDTEGHRLPRRRQGR